MNQRKPLDTSRIMELGLDDDRLTEVAPLLAALDGIGPDEVRRIYREGYATGLRLSVLYDDDVCVAAAAWRVIATFQWGRKLQVEDLVTNEDSRSRGHGAALIEYLEARARVAGCSVIDLDSGVQRSRAHRFYLRHGFDITKHHSHRDL